MPPYYVDEDYPVGPEINEPLSLNEVSDMAQNRPLYIWRYALIVVHARYE